ncbi:putative epoxide hydrolase [Hypsizygus marmoreus]|uniref:Epoxide hydrolase n=1 Tax=Hypsizygus marmoreus TaxID=39966 RepID=A0A369JEU6_HYPMA|nr:putative epoxide hydrolase [Hypsizygus marmoreus]
MRRKCINKHAFLYDFSFSHNMSFEESPFKIAIPDSQISLLQQKLALATFPNELEDAGWSYGTPLADVQRLVNRWKDGYDWRKHEAALNAELPQFTRDIDVEGFGALNIHYVHKRSVLENAIPLLFVHGWPGSFIEVRKILPLLTEVSSDHPSFHVVALSLPGYGFSAAPTKKGFNIAQYAEVGNKLMLSLGYDEYVTQGGDWGYLITRKIANLYGHKRSKAWHTNFAIGAPPSLGRPILLLSHLLSNLPLLKYSPREQAGLARTAEFRARGQGYSALQSTKPQTLGYGLTDSPVGLLAWIYEKLVGWTDAYPWEDDEGLDHVFVMVDFWTDELLASGGPAASLRIYYEVIHANPDGFLAPERTTIPLGYSHFPQEHASFPRSWTKRPGLIFEAEHDSGGHFPAYETPAELVGDLRKMFGKGGGAFGVVKGKNGYA